MQTRCVSVSALFFILCLTFSLLKAADIVDLSTRDAIATQQQRGQTLHVSDLRAALGLSSQENLVLLRQVRSSAGTSHLRYEQTFQGVAVYGHHVLVTQHNADQLIDMAGSIVTGIESDMPNLIVNHTTADRLSLLKAAFLFQAKKGSEAWTIRDESSRKVIFIDKFKKARLCIEASFVAEAPSIGKVSRPHYIVDAHTGEVLDSFDNIQFAQASGPGGNVKTGRYEYGVQYPYLNVTADGSLGSMENDKVVTQDLANGEIGFTHTFTMPRNEYKYANEAYCPINDAHFFGSVVFNMYQDWYSTSPLTFKLRLGVHYGVDYENAFWDGKGMKFGDGKTRFYPLVSLDVVAHEVSHGFTEQNSNLIYTRQSGGLNESFSDIAAKAVEFYARGSNPWSIAAEIIKNGDGLRFMDNPPKDKRSIDSATKYHDEMNVHYSSGVFNKMFYHLATTQGWNTRKAFDVFVLANQAYWEPSSSFKQAAVGLCKAAEVLGYGSQDVSDALLQVAIDIKDPDAPAMKPESLTATATGKSMIALDWKPGQLIRYYDIFMSQSPEADFTAIGTTSESNF
ncbi:MAG: peptidase M4 family protein, partial [Chitinivibrionales bacterium]|nr:peptidase M4 family protein [Chitinivibrionales bacterium]